MQHGSVEVDKPQYGKGLQLADTSLSLFSWTQPAGPFGKYDFLFTTTLSDSFVETYFTDTDLRLTLEVESVRPIASDNRFRWIKVNPAYEFEIQLGWQQRGGRHTNEVSTVVHLLPPDHDHGESGKAYTYDTHGTAAR